MSILGTLTLIPRAKIGAIEIQASIEEQMSDTLEVTEHPVQTGASITDHSYKRPPQVVIHCGWSDSSPESFLATIALSIANGRVTGANLTSGLYSQLLNLQERRTPFSIVTSLRVYDNMLITNIAVRRDAKNSQALLAEVSCRGVIFVDLKTVSMPPITDQGNPKATAETQAVGTVSPAPGTPAPGGIVPSTGWTYTPPWTFKS